MITEYVKADYRGYDRYDFSFAGRTGIVILPKTPRGDGAWVWRTEYLGAFDMVDAELLHRGWALVYYTVSYMYGSPEAIGLMHDFYRFVVPAFGLNAKCDMFGFSVGGLYAFNYACAYPESVLTLYLDAPVLDMRDWPCDERFADTGYAPCSAECLAQYKMTREEMFAQEHLQPVDRLYTLIHTGIPVVVVAGAADRTVDFRRNGRRLCDALYSAGYDYLEIVKENCDHHPHSLEDPTPVADFIASHR